MVHCVKLCKVIVSNLPISLFVRWLLFQIFFFWYALSVLITLLYYHYNYLLMFSTVGIWLTVRSWTRVSSYLGLISWIYAPASDCWYSHIGTIQIRGQNSIKTQTCVFLSFMLTAAIHQFLLEYMHQLEWITSILPFSHKWSPELYR